MNAFLLFETLDCNTVGVRSDDSFRLGLCIFRILYGAGFFNRSVPGAGSEPGAKPWPRTGEEPGAEPRPRLGEEILPGTEIFQRSPDHH